MKKPIIKTKNPFLNAVVEGFSEDSKHISSQWFYDKKGDAIFQQIMELPEYYLTRAEYANLNKNAATILNDVAGSKPLTLVELGAGDGKKTRIILEALISSKRKFQYAPIDISSNALESLTNSLHSEFKTMEILPLQAEYFDALKSDVLSNSHQKLVLFLGSNIGNLTLEEAGIFYQKLYETLNPGDAVLTGFDRVKNPEIILSAYNDNQGVTAQFNLNLLSRMNKELGANFNLEHWSHQPEYQVNEQKAESYLVSSMDQEVAFSTSGNVFHFKAGEKILTEISRKFTLNDIHQMAEKSGFSIVKEYHFGEDVFTNSLWVKR